MKYITCEKEPTCEACASCKFEAYTPDHPVCVACNEGEWRWKVKP